MTNSRNTVVLQDEISFSSPTSLTWVLNIYGNLSISEDGKTVIARDGFGADAKRIRITMLTDDDSLRFVRLKNGETVLSNTITKANSGIYGTCDTEQRIAIKANQVTDFNVAVVFELLDFEEQMVGYSKVPMADWTTADGEWLEDANEELRPPEKQTYLYNASHFAYALAQFEAAGTDWKKYREIINETRIYLTDYDHEDATLQKMVREYDMYLLLYNLQVQKINKEFEEIYTSVMPVKDSLT